MHVWNRTARRPRRSRDELGVRVDRATSNERRASTCRSTPPRSAWGCEPVRAIWGQPLVESGIADLKAAAARCRWPAVHAGGGGPGLRLDRDGADRGRASRRARPSSTGSRSWFARGPPRFASGRARAPARRCAEPRGAMRMSHCRTVPDYLTPGPRPERPAPPTPRTPRPGRAGHAGPHRAARAAATRGMFITDVIVELGYADPRARRRGDRRGAAGRPLAGGAPARAEGDRRRPALARDRRALRPRPRRPQRLQGRHGRREPALAGRRPPLQGGPGRLHVDNETLLLAMADPANVLAVDDIQMMTGLNCRSRSPPRTTSRR